MGIYHHHMKNISRRKGPVMKAVSYACGKTLYDNNGVKYDYTHKQEVVYSEIILPPRAPPEFHDRETLWNAVDAAENRKDARTAREIEIALPAEFDRNQQIELVQEYVQKNFVDKGMCVDFSLHDKGNGNPHSHILLTTRTVTPEGFSLKDRTWNKRENLLIWRKSWADMCNRKFIQLGIDQRIDHRTLAAQGIDREPTIHLGQKVVAMERRGKKHERGERYRQIVARNMEQDAAKKQQKKQKRKKERQRGRSR